MVGSSSLSTRAKRITKESMKKLIAFMKESVVEMRDKVSWPKYKDLQNSSVLVLVASMIFAMMIGVFDLAFDNAMTWFYSAF